MSASGRLLTKPAADLLADFGAGNASPGSGSAAALMGLLACKLVITVCLKSLQKEECKSDFNAFRYIKSQVADVIEPRLRELFERDASDFEEVVRLRRLRDEATDPVVKSQLSRQANDLLEAATSYSFEIIDLCFKLVDHGIAVFNYGWKPIRGDSGAAISASLAGVTSGIFIANLNLKTLKERKFASERIKRCAELYADLGHKQAKAFECVTSLNSEAIAAIQLDLQ